MTDPTQAGTLNPDPNGGTAGAAGTSNPGTDGGTSGTADKDARIAQLENTVSQLLGEKSKFEQNSALVRQLQEEIATIRVTAQPPATADPRIMRQQALQQRIQAVAQDNPEVVGLMGDLLTEKEREDQQRFTQIQQQQQWDRELRAIPEKDQEEVDSRARKLGVGPEWAYTKIKAERHDKLVQDLAEKNRLLAEDEERRRKGTVETIGSAAPPKAPAPAGEITVDEHDRLIEVAMPNSGASDEERKAAKAKLDLVEKNKLRIRYG